MLHNIFAMELCIRLEPGNRLREEVQDLILSHPAASTPGGKWSLLKRITEKLLENQELFEKGCWDFFDDDGRALKDYDMWCNGMITEEGARPGPSSAPGEGDGARRYMTFTVALLLVAGSECARGLEALCDIPEGQLWRHSTFVRILRGLRRVSFAAVKSDVIYVIPGDARWGLTLEDLQHPKFHYLRPIVPT